MLNRIIEFSLKRRLVVLIGGILLLCGGFYTANNMEVDVFPDLNAPTVVVMTEAKGLAPEEVERLVSFPVETALNGATNVRRVRSASSTGFSTVWVEFDWGTDIYRARQIVSEKLSIVKESLSSQVGNPTMGPQTSILGELMIVGITSDSTSMRDVRTIADWQLRPRLLSIGGVAQVSVLGGELKEYQIQLDPEKMRLYEVSLPEILEALDGMNQNTSGGIIYEYGNEYLVRAILSLNNVDELGKVLVKMKGDNPLLLENIANVKVGSKFPRLGVASNNTKDAVLLTITKQVNSSTLELTEDLKKAMAELQKELPPDVKIEIPVFQQASFIQGAITNIKKALLEGGIFVVVVLFFFLMNLRTTIISVVTIPLSLLVSILVLKFMDLSINTMSLGGMAIAIGSLVDDSIVDVENIYKRLQEHRTSGLSKSVIQVVFEASKEVRMPIFYSTLIIVASFLPLFFLSGMEGLLLLPLGISFVISLFASSAVALTITPVLCSYLLANVVVKERATPLPIRLLQKYYSKSLHWALHNKILVLSFTSILFLISVGVFLSFGRSFLPPFNEGSFTINITALPGISLEESNSLGKYAENLLLTVPEVQAVGRKTGRAELNEHALGVNVSEIEVPYVLGDRSKEEVLIEMRKKLAQIPGVNVEIGQPISHRIDAMLSGTRANIAIKIFGKDLNSLLSYGNRIKANIAKVEGIADLTVEQQVDRPQIKIKPKRLALAQYGITLPQFAQAVETFLVGTVVSQVYEGKYVFDLMVRVENNTRDTKSGIEQLLLDGLNGEKVPISAVSEVVSSKGPNTINHENSERRIVVSANVTGRDLRSVVKDIQDIINKNIVLEDGYRIEYGGQFESAEASSRILFLMSIFSVVIILFLLYMQFKNVGQSLIILLNLPLALIGGVFSIYFSSGVLSIPGIIGFISLFGIATRNGMLLLSRYNDLQSTGRGLLDSIKDGSVDRLNPILMTALSSALALIPLVLAGGLSGNEIQSPMAQVLLGGLLSSTLLNGYIIPIMYFLLSRNTENSEIKE